MNFGTIKKVDKEKTMKKKIFDKDEIEWFFHHEDSFFALFMRIFVGFMAIAAIMAAIAVAVIALIDLPVIFGILVIILCIAVLSAAIAVFAWLFD